MATPDTLTLVALAVGLGMLWMSFRGAPPVPSKPGTIADALALLALQPGERFVDLGCGDGRVVEAASRAGAAAHGVEGNPILVWAARRRLSRAGLSGRATVRWGSLWKEPMRDVDAVFVFGAPHLMSALSEKFRRELKPGARIASNTFVLPGLAETGRKGAVRLYCVTSSLGVCVSAAPASTQVAAEARTAPSLEDFFMSRACEKSYSKKLPAGAGRGCVFGRLGFMRGRGVQK